MTLQINSRDRFVQQRNALLIPEERRGLGFKPRNENSLQLFVFLASAQREVFPMALQVNTSEGLNTLCTYL